MRLVLALLLDPIAGDLDEFPFLFGRMQDRPTPDDFFIAPGFRDFSIEPQQQMEVIVQNGIVAHRDRVNVSDCAKPILEPLFAVRFAMLK
jgi:hypothetical protein